MSSGLGMNIRQVFLWNFLPDVSTDADTGSGTIAINLQGCGLILHAHRLAPALAAHCKLVSVHSHGNPGFFGLYLPDCADKNRYVVAIG